MNNLEDMIGYKFKNGQLFREALTHISYANDNNVGSYERLEFLGDAVIELIVSDYIYNHLSIDSGSMTKLRASLVSTEYLGNISKLLGLQNKVQKSKSLQQLGRKNIADLFESIVGAVYIDGGLEEAKKLIMRFVIKDEQNINFVIKNSIDYKSRLQEHFQAQNKEFEYKVLCVSGPDHQREYEVSLEVEGKRVAISKASSIQHAEEKCAEEYMATIIK